MSDEERPFPVDEDAPVPPPRGELLPLHRETYQARRVLIGQYSQESLQVEVERIRKEVLLAFSMDFLAEEEVEQTEVVEWPADWKQAFKMRWFPAWMLGRWPVRMTRLAITFRAKALYPEANWAPDWLGRRCFLLTLRRVPRTAISTERMYSSKLRQGG